jgi:hypothetical protein
MYEELSVSLYIMKFHLCVVFGFVFIATQCPCKDVDSP